MRDLFGFAPIPPLVLYLKIDVATLIRRVINRGLPDYFESGMDIMLGDDPYDSFKQYQTLLIREYNNMSQEFNFNPVNARMKPARIHDRLRQIVSNFFGQRKFLNWQQRAASEIAKPPRKSPNVADALGQVLPTGLSQT